ncbi:MAG: photosystem II manganese-stabilizing polypeptide [Oscillatoria sp. PMC 1068.18]|nr:photosystem II manganese-stabilizing polypeptide [Oscillatoria sp. PMC 1076.18]MEC4989534.1 photosystem II manganese-stabilizing polypeptide [Oscillatoria sp. PMC 1068.18]
MRRYRVLIVAFLAVCLGVLTACSEGPATATSREQLTYDQIVNTGLANACPQLTEISRGSIAVEPDKSYRLVDVCLEPKEFFVEEEPTNKRREAEFVQGKLLTRYTTSLEQISAQLKVEEDGSLIFIETGGIDFQPVTVQLPGGEQIPFMFTIKRLVAASQPGLSALSTATDFKGDFYVPSYRGNVFLDPKGRGVASGYDNAVALPSQADAEELARSNVKRLQGGQGEISLQVEKVDRVTGEIAGTFESEQPSDTDLGADEPEQVKIRGIFYARVVPDFS